MKKRKNLIKFPIICALGVTILLSPQAKTFASEDTTPEEQTIIIEEQITTPETEIPTPEIPIPMSGGIASRAEERGYIYKIWEQKQWKRLWSYTYIMWIDPEWTLA